MENFSPIGVKASCKARAVSCWEEIDQETTDRGDDAHAVRTGKPEDEALHAASSR
jgi:hypothetical protein